MTPASALSPTGCSATATGWTTRSDAYVNAYRALPHFRGGSKLGTKRTGRVGHQCASFASVEQVDRDHHQECGSEAGDEMEEAEVREDLGLPLLRLCRFGPPLGLSPRAHSFAPFPRRWICVSRGARLCAAASARVQGGLQL